MYQQQTSTSEHSGLAVVLGWVGAVPISIWAWPHVNPFVLQFLAAFRPTIGKDIAALLYFAAPIALFLLVLYGIMFFVDEVILDGFRFRLLLGKLGQWLRHVRGEKSGWDWVGWVFVMLVILHALGNKT